MNKQHGTNVSARTVRCHFDIGTSLVLPKKGGGKKPRLPAYVEAALENFLKTFMNISNASMKLKPDRKDLIARINKCLKKGGVNFKRFDHYYDLILNMIADEVMVAGGNSKIEERRAVSTTFNNINAWFDNLKQFLLYHKSACESTP